MKVLLLALKFKIIEILRIALSVGKLNFAEDETASFCISSLLKERRYSRMDANSIVSF